MNTIFSSFLHHDYSFISQISPQSFCSCLIEQLQTNLDHSALKANQGNSNLIGISALIELLELPSKTSQFINQSDIPEERYFIRSAQAWFTETHKILLISSQCIARIMVTLQITSAQTNRCKFSTFLSRRLLSKGLKTGFFQIDHILHCLEDHVTATEIPCTSAVVLLKDLVSQVLKRSNEISSTLSWFENVGILQKLSNGLQTENSSYKLTEYLLFLQKFVKLGVTYLDSEKHSVFLRNLFCKVFLPNIQSVLRLHNGDGHNFLCLQTFKVIDILLMTKWLHQDQKMPHVALEILHAFHIQASCLLSFIQSCNYIYSDISFTGKEKTKIKNDICIESHSSSNLLRFIIVVFLKACALSTKEEPMRDSSCCSVQPFLQLFQLISKQPTDDKSLQEWFEINFADQDNQWISSLFSLLIIHKFMKKRHPSCHNISSANSDADDTFWSFLVIFCPHKLFLNFVNFIDYDHLVISDFLISPETCFLPYFLSYLHYLLEDWVTFQSIINGKLSGSTVRADSKEDDTTAESEKIIDRESKCESQNSFNVGNSTRATTSKDSHGVNSHNIKRNVQIVSYSDSETDSEDSNLGSPYRKKSCLETEILSEDLQEEGKSNEYFQFPNIDASNASHSFGLMTDVQDKFDRVMGMFIRLRIHIDRLEEKGLFPYRAKPLIKLLELCEENFESQ